MEKYKQTPSNDHSLKVLGVLGPLGAGKTTTLNQLIERVPVDTSYAVGVNAVRQAVLAARMQRSSRRRSIVCAMLG